MKQYGKPIYRGEDFDGYDDLVEFCDRCGNESEKLFEHDNLEVCGDCRREMENEEYEKECENVSL